MAGRSSGRGGFSWRLVDPALVEKLLLAAAPAAERRRIHQMLGDAPDRAQAARASAVGRFGQATKITALRPVINVLRDDWLLAPGHERALADVARDLEEMTGRAGPGRSAEDARAQRQFVADFRPEWDGWSTFERSLLREFRHAHRVDGRYPPRRRRPGGDDDLLIARTLKGRRITSAQPGSGFDARDYQQEAWAKMDALTDDRRGLGGFRRRPMRAMVRLPTGAGKTDVAVRWIVKRMQREGPNLRVLWLSHQVFLLEQAAARFEAVIATEMPESFERKLRLICDGRATLSELSGDRAQIALSTMQTIGRALKHPAWASPHRYVAAFFDHPLIVVIDEAHHAGNDSYARVLKKLKRKSHLIGMTATPWPSGALARKRLKQAFPDQVIDKTPEDLARYLAKHESPQGLKSGVSFHLTDRERRAWIRQGDPSLATQKAVGRNEKRTRAVVDHYRRHHSEWGRTLIFSPTIENAKELERSLAERGVDVRRVDSTSSVVLDDEFRRWFQETDEAVVVSVAMLLEGVDLPLARTALIARPTSSPIVLNQMIGRVLRRVAGKKEHAIIVYVQDDWTADGQFEELLNPTTPWIMDVDSTSDEDTEFEGDVADLLARVIQAQRDAGEEPDSDLDDREIDILLDYRQVVGAYTTEEGEIIIPVLDNQRVTLGEFVARLSDEPDAAYGFEDDFPPSPSAKDVERLRSYVLAHRGEVIEPQLFDEPRSPAMDAARKLGREPNQQPDQRRQVIDTAYATDPFARALYADRGSFAAAVQRAITAQRRQGLCPEQAIRNELRLPPNPERELAPLWDAVLANADDLLAHADKFLPEHHRVQPTTTYDVDWTTKARPRSGTLAFWKLSREPGRHIIRVNRALQTTEELVSNEMLKLLLWHELVHSVTISHGHDTTFATLQDQWPGFLETNARLNSLGLEFGVHDLH